MIDIKKIPNLPGVYIMKDSLDNILYIGKAKNLNSRIKQYFSEDQVKKRGMKIEKMVSLINDIEYIVTDNEVEALVLENNLIKEYLPKYNTLLKDNKTYPYIKITNEIYPRLIITRTIEKDKARYFGPFVDVNALNNVVDLIKDLYKIRYCDINNLPKKPCLYYDIKKCCAPCINDCYKEYNTNIKKVLEIFSGDIIEVLKMLNNKMSQYSDVLDFENAMKYRDLINNLKKITTKQNINNNFDSQDIIAYENTNDGSIVVMFFVRNGKLVNKEHFYMQNCENVLSTFIQQYYHSVINFPKEILIEEEIEDKQLLQKWINNSNNSTKIIVPKKGHKLKLIQLAKKNAKILVNEDLNKIKNKENKVKKQIKEIESIIEAKINKIESYDISNTSGVLNVASMVIFENNKFKKDSYRKFKLNTNGSDDYKCMQEVITRRFQDNKMKIYPDLILIDGGKGQVNCVLKVLQDLDLKIPVCGMVKDDHHRTRGLYFNNKEYKINKCINLITQIQDETHRFALNYHSILRTKQMLHSIINDIDGIGDKKKQLLLDKFGSVENISKATKEELKQIPKLSEKDISNIINFFSSKKNG